jgi:hypothetical protein
MGLVPDRFNPLNHPVDLGFRRVLFHNDDHFLSLLQQKSHVGVLTPPMAPKENKKAVGVIFDPPTA